MAHCHSSDTDLKLRPSQKTQKSHTVTFRNDEIVTDFSPENMISTNREKTERNSSSGCQHGITVSGCQQQTSYSQLSLINAGSRVVSANAPAVWAKLFSTSIQK